MADIIRAWGELSQASQCACIVVVLIFGLIIGGTRISYKPDSEDTTGEPHN